MKCILGGCNTPAEPKGTKGYCKYHYIRCGWNPRPTRGMTPAQRLDFYTDKSGGPDACWPWTGSTTRGGYGKLTMPKGKVGYAHRTRWTLEHGDPGTLHVLHSCDSPRCTNPRHLFLGTHQDNMADRGAQGRGGKPKPRLSPAQRLRIQNGGDPPATLAAEFGVTLDTIYRVRRKAFVPFST